MSGGNRLVAYLSMAMSETMPTHQRSIIIIITVAVTVASHCWHACEHDQRTDTAQLLQAKPATLASLVGALNLRNPTHPAAQASLRALGEEECTRLSTPPQLEYARPVWTQTLLESSEASSSGSNRQASFAIPASLRSAAVPLHCPESLFQCSYLYL